MKLDGASGHLTYCSNIHPGETWAEVRANLGRYVPSVRDQVARGRPFGIGLRLSAEAAQTLAQPEAMAERYRKTIPDAKISVAGGKENRSGCGTRVPR